MINYALLSAVIVYNTPQSSSACEDTFITDNGASEDLFLLAISKQKPDKKASVFSGWSG